MATHIQDRGLELASDKPSVRKDTKRTPVNIQLKNWKPGYITRLPDGYSERTQYTNIAVSPEGHLRPWPGVGTTFHPPMLRTDGQITWLPSERKAAKPRTSTSITQERNHSA